MHRLSLLTFAVSSLSLAAFGVPTFASFATNGYRLSGPAIHDNLAIYFVHGRSESGPVPLTLQEALAKGSLRVFETGHVNELAIENLGDEEVFVQSGDIVKGGQQDRVLTVSLLLPPRSGRIAIASFCVEQGRWTARGREDVKTFASSAASVPSRKAKLAMKDPRLAASGSAATSARQYAVWDTVASIQHKLSENLRAPVAAPQSRTSLQLALENEKLRAAQAAYVEGLQAAGEKDGDIVGYVFAINGRINSGDIYPSNGLFRKMWVKLLRANATEAIGERGAATASLPTLDAVQAFLNGAEAGRAAEKELTHYVSLETRDADNALYFETRRGDGRWVHRNYLAK